MTSISQEQQAMSEESFQAELRAWLAANITDEFREKRNMTFQEKVPGLAKKIIRGRLDRDRLA